MGAYPGAMDPFVALARAGVEQAARTGVPLEAVPGALAQALPTGPGACFVSLHDARGALRGCIGTLAPTRATLAEEILANAFSAARRDRRFAPLEPRDLTGLSVKVEVLSVPEPVLGLEGLDPRRYGVVVTGPRGERGVLLPDLEGIDTAEQQVRIACRKAGLAWGREAITLQRFTVERHG